MPWAAQRCLLALRLARYLFDPLLRLPGVVILLIVTVAGGVVGGVPGRSTP